MNILYCVVIIVVAADPPSFIHSDDLDDFRIYKETPEIKGTSCQARSNRNGGFKTVEYSGRCFYPGSLGHMLDFFECRNVTGRSGKQTNSIKNQCKNHAAVTDYLSTESNKSKAKQFDVPCAYTEVESNFLSGNCVETGVEKNLGNNCRVKYVKCNTEEGLLDGSSECLSVFGNQIARICNRVFVEN